ncbi:ABC transporter substrate-binding protein [Oceanispirochaeta crateris]|uniref:ABC transporter substrate-binding protein n=1 Tax=Oceanispirochaeta crateris TaxID=2518645 RepID=A0A5C1QKK9_9SPIO|nr:MqnA/MqnD/SBP family protein [Oceanispirochaeta crateris]QEN07858.1 ABC transporter substrate-binding protein [Oceanispirochaeta crateris]
MKRFFLLLIISMSISISLMATGSTETISRDAPLAPVRIALLNGPSGIGLVRLSIDNPFPGTEAVADIQLLGAPKVLTGQILKGEWDAAVLPANMAALLYNKGVAYKTAAVTGMGNLYLVANKDVKINSIADFGAQTVHIPGKNTTPDLITQLIAAEVGATLHLDYSFNPADLAKALAGAVVEAAVLPEPLATIALKSGQDLHIAADMQALWKETFPQTPEYPLTVIVVKSDFAENHPDLVDLLMDSVEKSLNWVAENPAEASGLIKAVGFTLPPPIVAQAIPRSNYIFLKGDEMRALMEPYFSSLMALNPEVLGGALPGDDFYN